MSFPISLDMKSPSSIFTSYVAFVIPLPQLIKILLYKNYYITIKKYTIKACKANQITKSIEYVNFFTSGISFNK